MIERWRTMTNKLWSWIVFGLHVPSGSGIAVEMRWFMTFWAESQCFSGWWFGCHFLFSHILGIIIPIDFHIFQRGGPTTNQFLLSIARNKKWDNDTKWPLRCDGFHPSLLDALRTCDHILGWWSQRTHSCGGWFSTEATFIGDHRMYMVVSVVSWNPLIIHFNRNFHEFPLSTPTYVIRLVEFEGPQNHATTWWVVLGAKISGCWTIPGYSSQIFSDITSFMGRKRKCPFECWTWKSWQFESNICTFLSTISVTKDHSIFPSLTIHHHLKDLF